MFPRNLKYLHCFILNPCASILASGNGIPLTNKADIVSSETFQGTGVVNYLIKNVKTSSLAHIPKIQRKQCD